MCEPIRGDGGSARGGARAEGRRSARRRLSGGGGGEPTRRPGAARLCAFEAQGAARDASVEEVVARPLTPLPPLHRTPATTRSRSLARTRSPSPGLTHQPQYAQLPAVSTRSQKMHHAPEHPPPLARERPPCSAGLTASLCALLVGRRDRRVRGASQRQPSRTAPSQTQWHAITARPPIHPPARGHQPRAAWQPRGQTPRVYART